MVFRFSIEILTSLSVNMNGKPSEAFWRHHQLKPSSFSGGKPEKNYVFVAETSFRLCTFLLFFDQKIAIGLIIGQTRTIRRAQRLRGSSGPLYSATCVGDPSQLRDGLKGIQ